jgi:catechol 2,3-dioxygenase-like lactoylglutathione lyase family enzyme
VIYPKYIKGEKIMSDYIVKGLAHIGIMAEDPRKCAEFYVEKLGFRHFYEKELGQMTLSFVENGGCVIEFVQKGPVPVPGTVDHIALEVMGIEALVAELKAAGVEFESENINHMADFFPNGVKNIFFKGPAGERIELFDYSR